MNASTNTIHTQNKKKILNYSETRSYATFRVKLIGGTHPSNQTICKSDFELFIWEQKCVF